MKGNRISNIYFLSLEGCKTIKITTCSRTQKNISPALFQLKITTQYPDIYSAFAPGTL